MKKFLSLVVFCCGLVFLDSCQKSVEVVDNLSTASARSEAPEKYTEDSLITRDYQVVDGILHFKSAKTFLALDSLLMKMDEKDQISFMKKLGLNSLRSYRLELYKALSQTSSSKEVTQLFEQNTDIGTQAEGLLVSNFNESKDYLLNRQGLVSIGGKIHCFAQKATIVGNTVSDVVEAYRSNRKTDKVALYLVKSSNAGARTSGTCSYIDRNAYNSDGKRQVNIYTNIEYLAIFQYAVDASNSFYTCQWTSIARGRAYKKQTFGGWTYYETNNTLSPKYYNYLTVYSASLPGYLVQINALQNGAVMTNYSTEITYTNVVYTRYNVHQTELVGAGPNGMGPTVQITGYSPYGYYYSDGVPNPGVPIDCP